MFCFIIDREAREIMYLVAFVRPSVTKEQRRVIIRINLHGLLLVLRNLNQNDCYNVPKWCHHDPNVIHGLKINSRRVHSQYCPAEQVHESS